MDITSALNRIEVVLAQYNAFKEVKEALEVAVGAEQAVVELGLRAEALRVEISDLEARRASAEVDADAVMRDAESYAGSVLADLGIQADVAKAEIADAKKVLAALKKDIKDRKAADEARMAAAEREVADIKAAADAELARFEDARKALAELREKL